MSGPTGGCILPPSVMWQYFPNQIELIVMDVLLRHDAAVDLADQKGRTALIYAARYGHIYSVSRLLCAKADMECADDTGRTALFHAAASEHTEVVEMLIRAGCIVNGTDGFFRTPLHGALDNNDEDMAMLLLRAEASVNAYDCESRTPIMLAMQQGNRQVFGALVERRANLDVLDSRGWNVVIYAIETGMLSEVLPILRKSSRASAIIRAYDPQGRNALHHAAMLKDPHGAQEAAECLYAIDYEAARIGDCNGDTPIHAAAELGRLDLLRLLTTGMQSCDFQNNRGETPLMHACHGGHLGCVVAMLRGGDGCLADAGLMDAEGRTVLMHACAAGHLDLVNVILQNRDGQHAELAFPPIDLNVGDHGGVTALMVAAREGHWQLLPSLVLAGADLAAKDKDGFTPLHWAVCEEAQAVASLVDLKADMNSQDGRGWTPLMYAAQGCEAAAWVLVDSRADLEKRNWDGHTALQVCVKRGRSVDILADGVMDSDVHTAQSTLAQGHFMISVLSGRDLFLEGRTTELNPYCCVQFCPRAGVPPMVAFTSCLLRTSAPDWHESFRFDTTELDPTGYLVVWVLSAPGQTAEEVVEGTDLGLDFEQIARLRTKRMVEGAQEARSKKPNFATSLGLAFERLTRQDDQAGDQAKRLYSEERSGEERLIVPKRSWSLEERRWNEVTNLRRRLEKSGMEMPEPLVPRAHLPIGCVVVRFRRLRSAVWGTEPVLVERSLRICSRGRLKVEVDFRPRYFIAYDPYAVLGLAEEEVGTPRAEVEIEETDTEEAAAIDRLGLRIDVEARARTFAKPEPEVMLTRFLQWSVWAHQVLQLRKELGPESVERLVTRRVGELLAKVTPSGMRHWLGAPKPEEPEPREEEPTPRAWITVPKGEKWVDQLLDSTRLI